MAFLRWIGDWVYAILVSLGWQPREERDRPEEYAPPHP